MVPVRCPAGRILLPMLVMSMCLASGLAFAPLGVHPGSRRMPIRSSFVSRAPASIPLKFSQRKNLLVCNAASGPADGKELLSQIDEDERAANKQMADSTELLRKAKDKKESFKKKFKVFEESQEEPLRKARLALEAAQDAKAQWGWVPFSNYDQDIKTAALKIVEIIQGPLAFACERQ